jgi:hypothetical protein
MTWRQGPDNFAHKNQYRPDIEYEHPRGDKLRMELAEGIFF